MTLQKTIKQLGLSPFQVAVKAKIIHPTIYSILKGGNPTIKTLLKLNKLGITCTISRNQIIWGIEK